jgi:hypothetical protein
MSGAGGTAGALRRNFPRNDAMLRTTHDLKDYSIGATDGPVGHVKDFYFDDDAWVIRYLVVETGSWLSNRRVLISPVSLHDPDWLGRTLPASITKAQVKDSPDVESHRPLSRQNEITYLDYYGYPNYWGGVGMWGNDMYPYAMMPGYIGSGLPADEREAQAHWRAEREHPRNDDPHLRSCEEVAGYHLHASDGEIGHVDGFLVDEQTWAIRYLVVNTSNWWIGHKVLIAPAWITGVNWKEQTLSVDLSRDSVKAAPPYDAGTVWSSELEHGLYEHYGRTGYWTERSHLLTIL